MDDVELQRVVVVKGSNKITNDKCVTNADAKSMTSCNKNMLDNVNMESNLEVHKIDDPHATKGGTCSFAQATFNCISLLLGEIIIPLKFALIIYTKW